MQLSVEQRPGPPATGARALLPPVAVVAAFYAVFVVARLAAFGWDPSAFVVAGDGITAADQAPGNLLIHRGTDGYDGQAYYRLSRDPLTDEVSEHGMGFRRPAYWQARIGYPMVAWAVSLGGQQALVPGAMLTVNLLAVVALAVIAAALARDAGRSPWLALLPALFAGYVVGVGQDLSEPLQGALLLGAVLALRRQRWGGACVALTAAALTRETSLILAVAVLVVAVGGAIRGWLRSRSYPDGLPPWWVGAVPLALYAGWRTWVRSRWTDALPAPPGDNIFTWPFWGLLRHVGSALADLERYGGNLVLVALAVAVVGLLASALAARNAGRPHERLALAAYLLMLACLPIWDRNQAYLRWCCEPVLLGWTLLLGIRAARLRVAALGGLVVALWLATALATFRYPDPGGWRAAPTLDRGEATLCSP